MLANHRDWCHWCQHHGNANEMDHATPRSHGGADNRANYLRIHGVTARCYTCRDIDPARWPEGRACNQERKAKPLAPPYRSRDW